MIPGQLPKVVQEWDKNLGDIILGLPFIQEDCTLDGVQLKDRLPVLVTHGLCHLIGYNHDNDSSWKLVCIIIIIIVILP